MILNQNLEKILINLGDFNINFALESAMQLINFLKEKFQLHISKDPNQGWKNCRRDFDKISPHS